MSTLLSIRERREMMGGRVMQRPRKCPPISTLPSNHEKQGRRGG